MQIEYVDKPKASMDIAILYDALGWLSYLHLTTHQLKMAMIQSFYVVYAYHGEVLIGTGRVVSDGIISAYICGIGVMESYREQGVGKEISRQLMIICEKNNLHTQLVCEENLAPFYEGLGFSTIGKAMKYSK
jgi:ribosomal protein S18 acetylase RimI-like enzyme